MEYGKTEIKVNALFDDASNESFSTGGYRVANWKDSQQKWPHLSQCDFPKPAKNEMVDVLIGVDNADLHYSTVDSQGQNNVPIARLVPLWWTCIG